MQHTPDEQAPRSFILPLKILAALLLVYLTTVHTLAAYLAETSPAAAVRLNSAQPFALTALAEQALPSIMGGDEQATGGTAATGTEPPSAQAGVEAPGTEPSETSRLEGFARLPKLDLGEAPTQGGSAKEQTVQDEETAAKIRDWLNRSLAANPLNPRPLSLLAALSIGANDDARALTFMNAAGARSARVPLTNYWLMKSSYEAKNYAEALRHADRLLRTSYQNMPLAAPYLGRIADAATDEMAAMLLTNPPWRELFFTWLKGNIEDPRMPLQLLLKLKQSPTPPTAAEFGFYTTLLINHKLYDLAYAAWLQSLDNERLAHAGFIYNGAFDYGPSSFPFAFEWALKPGSGVITDIVTTEDTNRALMIRFGPGRVDFKPVSQMTMLAPGNYSLTARYRGDIKSRRGLKWRIECAGAPVVKLAESDPINGATPTWTSLSIDFSVPKEGCRAQLVQFLLDARSTSETMVSGSILIDDVAIKRQEQASVAQ